MPYNPDSESPEEVEARIEAVEEAREVARGGRTVAERTRIKMEIRASWLEGPGLLRAAETMTIGEMAERRQRRRDQEALLSE